MSEIPQDSIFPELTLPDDIGKAIVILEDEVLVGEEQLGAQRRKTGGHIGHQIAFLVAFARVQADIETLSHLYAVRDNEATLQKEDHTSEDFT